MAEGVEVVLVRDISVLKNGCLGRWHVNGDRLCDTLEDPVRSGPKVQDDTAIKAGGRMVLRPFVGARLGRVARVWREVAPGKLTDPVGFECICVHKGNTKRDLRGCIALGYSGVPGYVGHSKDAFDLWMATVEPAWKRGERVGFTIIDPPVGRVDA